MKYIFLILMGCSFQAFAASCCVGSGPKSFIQLRNFEKYQLGFSFSYKDSYAKYSPYGTLVETKKLQRLNSSLGAGARLRDDLEAYMQLPYTQVENRSGLGDVVGGLKFTLVDPLYLSDWYPKTSLNFSLKIPTGKVETIDTNGDVLQGTGNGIWEPSVGLLFEKDFTLVLANISAGYTFRSEKEVPDSFSNTRLRVKEGDRFEVSEAIIIPATEALSFALGSNQVWELATQINSKGVNDSHGRSIQGFLSSTYFLSRMWKVTLGFESTLPLEGWGTTLQANRFVSFTSTYSIY